MGKKAKFGAEPSDRTVDSNTIHEENNRQTFVFVFFEVGQNERAYYAKHNKTDEATIRKP